MPSKTERSPRNFIPPLIFFMVSLVFVLPFLINWDYIGVGDWELFATMAAVPQRTVLHYHQFPFWNPYLGGGNILFAHPEVGILSPFFPLILIFGAIGGLKIQMMLAYFLGFWGTWLLAKRLGRSPLASYLAAFVYFGSSYFALHFAIGHVPFTHFCFLPWFLYFLLKTDDDSRFLAGAIAAVALIILGNGAAVPFLYTCFFSGVLLILYAIEEKSLRLIKRFIVAVILGVLLGAVKFFPMFHYLSQNEWEGMPGDFTPINILWKAFFSFDQAVFRQAGSGQYWGWHEYSAYISPLAVILAVAALILAFRKSRAWLVVGLFFFLFGLGHFSDFSPWNLILHIPGFSSIRSPARTFQFVVLATAILSGIGLDVLTARLKSATSVKNALSLSIICLILLTGFLVNLPAMKTIKYKKPAHVAFDEDFRQVIGRRDDIYNLFLKNRGSLVAPWLSAYKESRGLVTPTNEVLMEYVSSGQAGVLTRQYTPNRVDYRLAPALAGTIIFGIGYDDGWRTADGRPLFENNGLVATGFTHNDRQITLLYRPRGFIFGLVVSLLVLAGLSVFIFHGKIRKRLEAIFN